MSALFTFSTILPQSGGPVNIWVQWNEMILRPASEMKARGPLALFAESLWDKKVKKSCVVVLDHWSRNWTQREEITSSETVALHWGKFAPPPEGIWQCRETLSLVTQLPGGVLLAAGGWRPGTLLNILQGTGQPPCNEELSGLKCQSAEVEKPCSNASACSIINSRSSSSSVRFPAGDSICTQLGLGN